MLRRRKLWDANMVVLAPVWESVGVVALTHVVIIVKLLVDQVAMDVRLPALEVAKILVQKHVRIHLSNAV